VNDIYIQGNHSLGYFTSFSKNRKRGFEIPYEHLLLFALSYQHFSVEGKICKTQKK